MEAQISLTASEDLVQAIDQQRAKEGVETGNLCSRAEWLREAAREKLEENRNKT